METMKIYFMTKPSLSDPLFKVGFMTQDGQRLIAPLWEQDGKHYVSSGKKVTGNLKIYWFTENQEQELKNFIYSTASNKEYWTLPVM